MLLSGLKPVDTPDLLGDQGLEPPEIAIADTLLFEMLDGEIEIFGTRSHMSASPCQDLRDAFER
jgi:hypothetical protein